MAPFHPAQRALPQPGTRSVFQGRHSLCHSALGWGCSLGFCLLLREMAAGVLLEVFEWGLLDLLAVPRKNKNWIYSSVNSESMLEEDVLKFEEGDRLSHSKLQWF
ncbi:PREDICTED: uncharacterized protein LOC108449540 isoform X1 [Corvus brachyrhynchos]|uniref:uncharacterized protein LOC108449540 isoform X1 n=1 Tax=Corvus brachyrhynchos TaxID=85066 RepID=UPI000816476D|nr:PREDICTED: uncharacterized protein LOC108449540 isoform X1 [Corvus brachyrhynchos]